MVDRLEEEYYLEDDKVHPVAVEEVVDLVVEAVDQFAIVVHLAAYWDDLKEVFDFHRAFVQLGEDLQHEVAYPFLVEDFPNLEDPTVVAVVVAAVEVGPCPSHQDFEGEHQLLDWLAVAIYEEPFK